MVNKKDCQQRMTLLTRHQNSSDAMKGIVNLPFYTKSGMSTMNGWRRRRRASQEGKEESESGFLGHKSVSSSEFSAQCVSSCSKVRRALTTTSREASRRSREVKTRRKRVSFNSHRIAQKRESGGEVSVLACKLVFKGIQTVIPA